MVNENLTISSESIQHGKKLRLSELLESSVLIFFRETTKQDILKFSISENLVNIASIHEDRIK